MHTNSIKQDFESFINDPGIQLSHSDKSNILLDDIYIFPDLIDLNNSIISSRELLKINSLKNNYIISGSEDSGKTTLLKILTKHYLQSGLYPIYINTDNFTVLDSKELVEIIYREYKEAYQENVYEDILSAPKRKKAILIDNFDKLNSSSEVMNDIINHIQSLSANIILTERIPLAIMNNSKLRTVFPEFTIEAKHYEIMEFDSKLRSELIQRWTSIGKDKMIDSEDVAKEAGKTQKFIDSVFEHGNVPSYPIFLLTILQMDTPEEEVSASTSSYAKYHEYLILKSLHKVIEKENISKYLDLLSKISFYMFDIQKYSLQYEEISLVHNTSLLGGSPVPDVIEHLLKSDVLFSDGKSYRLKSKYAYHYFVAKYLAENLDSESTKKILEDLCSKLYNDECANIILFITYLSEDTAMIDELAEKAEVILSEIEGISHEDDIPDIDELITDLTNIGTKDRKAKEAIAQYSNKTDERSESDFHKSRKSFNAAISIKRIARQILVKQKNK